MSKLYLKDCTRRELLEFMGKAGCAFAVSDALLGRRVFADDVSVSLPAAQEDDLVLIPGLRYRKLLTWGDKINDKGERFGFNNDYTAVIPLPEHPQDLLLWVNHEYLGGTWPGRTRDPKEKTEADVRNEMTEVGGSIVRITKTSRGWKPVFNDSYNRRIDATSPIKLVSDRPVNGSDIAMGTIANCAGGVTPWGSILTCEENYDVFYGEVKYHNGKREVNKKGIMGWERFFDNPAEHYGWVVEVDPLSAKSKKLTALGRFSHESATVVCARDGRCVVYMGDDRTDEYIYKFISDTPDSLEKGALYVANTETGEWLLLDQAQHPELRSTFSDQTDLLVQTRKAAKIVGATPQDRPEGIAVDQQNNIFIALTNNFRRNRPYGSIVKIVEKDNDPLALSFSAQVLITGGVDNGLACPDNIVFDPQGNLWIATDMPSSSLNSGVFSDFGNNSLFFMPLQGASAGRIFRVASAPNGAELTGPAFSSDGKTLFLSIQHPGEGSVSHWPGGGDTYPRPAVVEIQGEFLDKYSAR